jgi:YD repeat-containing protein
MDKDGNLINSPDNGVAITQYKYDELGNRTETLTFNKDMAPVKV